MFKFGNLLSVSHELTAFTFHIERDWGLLSGNTAGCTFSTECNDVRTELFIQLCKQVRRNEMLSILRENYIPTSESEPE